jgi:ABC-type glycerol-3-phosphate transport system permease component
MPLLSHSSRHSWSQRIAVAAIYFILSFLGLTMIIPFMMTVSSSLSNNYDYEEFRPLPRYLYSPTDRFVKAISGFFNGYGGWSRQLLVDFPNVPDSWSTWYAIGGDTEHGDDLARTYLEETPAQRQHTQVMAGDYADFAETYPVDDSVTPVDFSLVGNFVATQLQAEFEARWATAHPDEAARASAAQRKAAALKLLDETFRVPYSDFSQVNFDVELQSPLWQQSWIPKPSPKYESFLELKREYKNLQFSPGGASAWRDYLGRHHLSPSAVPFPVPVDAPPDQRNLWLAFRREVMPASPTVPYALRAEWRRFLLSEKVADLLHLGRTEKFDVAHYNALAGTLYQDWSQLPFPVPADAPAPMRQLWDFFVQSEYPVRLTSLNVTPQLTAQYQQFLQQQFKTVASLDQLLGTSYTQWTDFLLAPELSQVDPQQTTVWVNFVKQLPAEQRTLHSSETAFQQFILARYGSLDALNKAWGTSYHHLEEVFPPFDRAYAVTFAHTEWAMTLAPALNNYYVICNYLLLKSNSLWVTIYLVILSIFCTLTVNPFAAYALSRFNLRGQQSIILFLLATSAFPAMISAIPGYLLMRDLGLLNTFAALVLPGAASGMSIFILKGFFDSLPPELFEAATIDGAKEWQIFLHVTMPLVKPILAIHVLGAFMGAFTGWAWALIICQDSRMWTLAVWMYQFTMTHSATPWIENAGFIIVSIPTLIVFLTCQKIILRGIIIPQMK